MSQSISVVINTLNEEKNIIRAIKSVQWADEILICDMHSDDKTVQVAKKLGVKVILHERVNFVEPARNFAISKALNPWILVLDPDEEIPQDLAIKLREIIDKQSVFDFVEIPRKNIIFGKWIGASGWWPDYQVRFFRKDSVVWTNQIHGKPQTKGTGLTLPEEENLAILHRSYQSIAQFIDRMNRYTDVQAKQLNEQGYVFDWTDLIQKPLNEFLSRFFAHRGYKDGLHGLALSLLQAYSFLVVYLKLWEFSKFREMDISVEQVKAEQAKSAKQLRYWVEQTKEKGVFKRIFYKIVNKI